MNTKWVDNEMYFGPNRRQRKSLRLGERRKVDDASNPPPLGALLRRARVQLTSNPSPEDRQHALQLVALAVQEAERLGLPACAQELRNVAVLIASEDTAQAEACILEAMALAAG